MQRKECVQITRVSHLSWLTQMKPSFSPRFWWTAVHPSYFVAIGTPPHITGNYTRNILPTLITQPWPVQHISLVERQKGLTTGHFPMQLDPFAFNMAIYMSHCPCHPYLNRMMYRGSQKAKDEYQRIVLEVTTLRKGYYTRPGVF